ncbi:hypothetical protein [Leptolyngbya iicbica]|uniref:Uncharacterized protein n=1 Tax=Lyngbya confervoides BDU141951 TaxID=1574623 RepID=A0A8T6QQP2_9CYAN|nr:hypothetical protein [Leptolyngbya sp. LK]
MAVGPSWKSNNAGSVIDGKAMLPLLTSDCVYTNLAQRDRTCTHEPQWVDVMHQARIAA